ncbi:hypothetical protein BST81_00635 [Leptolyngbya sp. 'hensonii']|uniref:hypothetical protein n=1 Tax=Leptolyngbya sp. 'hensonii' TaxID=1922337 RepID=UPI00095005BA|nr:hypothetical protein [Leptolyngbya sp. 'hensonii']OLP20281.1 hypothetical protein BST81_00635 [Leptolyngbya sp. 'hensonii']
MQSSWWFKPSLLPIALMGLLSARPIGLAATQGNPTNLPTRPPLTSSIARKVLPRPTTLPQGTQKKILQKIAQDLAIPIDQLKLTAARSAVWDGCLGVAGPMQACTKIAISGWQVIIAGPQQYWVYHTDQNGSRIKQNPTTSGKGRIVPTFWTFNPRSFSTDISDNVVFQSITTGGIAGVSYKTILLQNGQVLRSDLRGNTMTPPQVVRKLSPQQVQIFVQALQQHELGDFLGFNYPAVQGSADYFTVTLMVPYGRKGVQYADIIQNQLPVRLQQVIQTWEMISSP